MLDMGPDHSFLDKTQNTSTKSKNKQVGQHQAKSFYRAKKQSTKSKDNLWNGRKDMQTTYLIRG